MLFVQHSDGLFQLALGAAALAHQRPHSLCEVAAKDGVQTLAHGVDAVGPAGDGGGVEVVVLLFGAGDPALLFQPV